MRITRQQATGTLVIDGGDSVEGASVGNTRVMTLQPPYSFGGVELNKTDDVMVNTGLDIDQVYRGCIRNIQVSGQPLGAPHKEVDVLPCADQIEEGVFFGGGYVKVWRKKQPQKFERTN